MVVSRCPDCDGENLRRVGVGEAGVLCSDCGTFTAASGDDGGGASLVGTGGTGSEK